MLADDLGTLISLYTFGARVPGPNPSFRIQHENRVVLYLIYKQPELLLSSTPFRLRVCGLRQLLGWNGVLAIIAFCANSHILLLGDYEGMLRADSLEEIRIFLPAKSLHRIRATKSERVRPREPIPKLLQLYRLFLFTLSPEESHHFPECHHALVRLASRPDSSRDRRTNRLIEEQLIELAVHEETRQHF